MQKITYGKIVIVVRRATIGDDLRSTRISRTLRDKVSEGTWGFWNTFADLNSHVVKSKGLPFDPLTLDSLPEDKLQAAYDTFMEMDKALKDQWEAAVALVDRPADIAISIEALPDDADPNL